MKIKVIGVKDSDKNEDHVYNNPNRETIKKICKEAQLDFDSFFSCLEKFEAGGAHTVFVNLPDARKSFPLKTRKVPEHERMVLKLDDAGVDYDHAREWMNHILALAFAEGASAMHRALQDGFDEAVFTVDNPYPISKDL